MEKLFFELGIYLPILVILSSLVFAFANVMTEKQQKKYSRNMLYLVSVPVYINSLLGFVLYIAIYTNISWIIAVIVCFLVSAIIITLAEELFRKVIKD